MFADIARVSDRDDLLPGLIGMLYAAGEKQLFVERWDAVNHIVQPECAQQMGRGEAWSRPYST